MFPLYFKHSSVSPGVTRTYKVWDIKFNREQASRIFDFLAKDFLFTERKRGIARTQCGRAHSSWGFPKPEFKSVQCNKLLSCPGLCQLTASIHCTSHSSRPALVLS